MDLTAIPFNQLVGLRKSSKKDVLLKLPFCEKTGNHLGTVHAGAIYTLAEAASGAFLVKHRGKRTNVRGVVRKATSKYSAPGTSTLRAYSDLDPAEVAAAIAEIDERGRSALSVPITIRSRDAIVGQFVFDWLLGLQEDD
ncbi:YiiD C-terminal domain-containing protein [Akkermansiaceae bacterium]|nr:YiiD C-terminal domain-containing protein [Akkermansiaceae bacterium]